MPRETILIVEAAPAHLKFMAGVLRAEGYSVNVASTAEQAASQLRFLQPRLILVSPKLPGMGGLELAARVKEDSRLQDTVVLALTQDDLDAGEQKTVLAVCDGYLTDTVDASTLTARVREYLDRGKVPLAPAGDVAQDIPLGPVPEAVTFGLPHSEMEDLRRSFLADGAVQSGQLLASLNGPFDANKASRIVHEWVGCGGLLGFPKISERAREVETLLRTSPWRVGQIRASFTNLVQAFRDPGVAMTAIAIPESIVQELSGKRVGLVGLADVEAERVCAALERVGAKPRLFEADLPPEDDSIRDCNVVMVHVRPETLGAKWLDPGTVVPPLLPVVFIGGRERLLSLDQRIHGRAREYLIDGWQPEEALMRLVLALTRPTVAPTQAERIPAPKEVLPTEAAEIVIADDDERVRAVVGAALQNYGMKCRFAANGQEALQLIRDHRPHAAVLDINMPGMDGFEVLAKIRSEVIPVRILLLTARQQENDVLRGFSLGADDYVTKPFSPMELVARLTRLLAR